MGKASVAQSNATAFPKTNDSSSGLALKYDGDENRGCSNFADAID
jgi:hypothetical protein